MTVINTNIKSLVAQDSLTFISRQQSTAMQQLSTGKRINSGADDAAGLAISSKMTSQIRGLNQAVRNGNDAISMMQTIEGATNEITNMLQRMRELAVQSASDTNTTDDRTFMNLEVTQLKEEIDRIAGNTQFNSTNVTNSAGTRTFQIGANATQTIDLSIKNMGTSTGVTSDISAAGVGTQASAAAAINKIDLAITAVNTERATLGAKINRMTYAVDNLTNVSTNTAQSRSRIEDTDYGKATTELARTMIIQQAGTAMLAQANQQPQSVLALLK